MRLLDVTTKRLESFYGDDIPRYAILSHMWAKEDDEVLFKHVAGSDDDRSEGEERKGYLKLSAACKQAESDGLYYIWIDTCCINKESSAELSEAINSMYAWYQRSEVCYAYLEDMRHEDGISGFKKSRWFTRGWTLQELIAPQRVVFYSGYWTDIGTKASLQNIISSVTGIRVEMITNYDPDKASVAERMSWAAKRQTTRAEDIAYCLMGLLGVNMPLLYGEGRRAFKRLQEEVMKDSDDHSIFAWRTHHSRYGPSCLELLREARGILADSPSDFQGAGDMVRSNHDGPYSAYSMSNRGLQIALPIRPIHPTDEELIGVDLADTQNIYKAILNCAYRDTSPTRWVVIYLKMVEKGRYVRIFPYWLNNTRTNPSEAVTEGWEVTSLLVPQVNLEPNRFPQKLLTLNILPTKSGYSYQGQSLVNGGFNSKYRPRGNSLGRDITREREHIVEMFTFDREGKHFGVAIGSSNGTIWVDIITEDEFEELNLPTNKHEIMDKMDLVYKEGESRYRAVLQCFNSPSINVSKDHSVNASGRPREDSYELTIDIREIITEEIPTYGHFFDDPRNIHPNFKKEGVDWFAVFNPGIQRMLDVSPVLSISNEEPKKIVFSPDGKYLATANHGRAHIYNTTTGDITFTCFSDFFKQDHDHIGHMCFSPDSNYFAICPHGLGVTGYIYVWDIIKKCLLRNFTFQEGTSQYSWLLGFTLDSRFIISVPSYGMVQSLDVMNGTSVDIWRWDHETPNNGMAISPDSRLIARAYEIFIRIWDVETKQFVAELQGRDQDVGEIMFTPDRERLVGVKKDKTLQNWHIGGLTWHSNDIWPVNTTSHRSSQDTLSSGISHKNEILHAAVSHDGRWIGFITITTNIGIQFWDSTDGTLQFTLRTRTNWYDEDSPGFVGSLLFNISPGSNIFATYIPGNNKLQIWKYDVINQS